MLHKFLTLFTALILVATGVAAQDPSEGGPRMVVPEKVIDIGQVAQGELAEVVFKIRNEGDATLNINAVRPTCSCTVSEYDKEIKAGKSGSITAKLDTRDFSGPISKSILVMTSDPITAAVTLIIKADVKPYVEILPRPLLRFNTLQKEGASEKLTVVSLDSQKNFKVLKAESSSSFLTSEIRKLSGADLVKGHPEQQYEITVTVGDDAPIGPLQDELIIHTNHEKAKQIRVKVYGVVRPVLQIEPAQLQFGPVQASAGPGRHLIVVNRRPSAPIEITSAVIDDPAFDVSVATVAEGKRYQVTVMVKKDAEKGSHDAKLTLSTTDKDFPSMTVPVRASIR